MRVDDSLLELAVADVRPALGIDEQFEAKGRRRCVLTADVFHRDVAVEQEEAAGLVGILLARVCSDLGAHTVGDHHHSERSIDDSMSSADQKSALRYFQPASASTQTTTPSSSSAASLRATWTTAPDETPAKIPSA